VKRGAFLYEIGFVTKMVGCDWVGSGSGFCESVQTYNNVNMNHVDYKYFDSGKTFRYVKVTVTASSG
jgi:hypothetical protein